LVKAVSL